MLVFAFIILLVSAFVIFNVFTILIGQRIRELGLLRAIGASGTQVTQALLGEALLVGIFATVVGTALGIGFGWSLRWLLGQLDFGPSGNELLLEPSTFLWGIAVGIGVTLASAIAPALRARRISPMAALREDARLSRHVPDAHLAIGGVVTIVSWIVAIVTITIPQTISSWIDMVIDIELSDWELILALGDSGLRPCADGSGASAQLGDRRGFGIGGYRGAHNLLGCQQRQPDSGASFEPTHWTLAVGDPVGDHRSCDCSGRGCSHVGRTVFGDPVGYRSRK